MAVPSSLYGYADSNINTIFAQNQRLPYSSSQPCDSLFTFNSSGSIFQGSSGSQSMYKFGQNNAEKRPFIWAYDEDLITADDDYCQPEEKKKRLKVDQIKFLEKRFEEDNRLEPDRKVQLAMELGLQPRQIAIWFQNRRARWKTKQTEKDYDVLQAKFNNLKADYEKLLQEKEKLKDEVHILTSRMLLDEKENGNSDMGCGSDVLSQDEDKWNMSDVYEFEKIENAVYSDNRAGSCGYGFLNDNSNDADHDTFGF